jgi:hypothetical protein
LRVVPDIVNIKSTPAMPGGTARRIKKGSTKDRN